MGGNGMMQRLTSADYPDWDARFSSFYDGVLERFGVDFEQVPSLVSIVFRSQDRTSSSGWSRVTLCLSGVRSLRLEEGANASGRVIFGGLHVVFEGDAVGVEWDLLEPPGSLAELMGAQCRVVAKSLEWMAEAM